MVVVLGGVKRMTMRDFGMMGGLFMTTGFRMLRCFTMMLGGVFVMFSGFIVMVVNTVLVHGASPRCLPRMTRPIPYV
jgi:hypothetical protein